VALRFHHRLAFGYVAHVTAITPTFQFHGRLPFASSSRRL
jgi:hypothetical protein